MRVKPLLVWLAAIFATAALAQPFPEPVQELCKTAEGRQRYIDHLSEISLKDIGFQGQGMGLSPEEALARAVELDCASYGVESDGYPFDMARAEVFDLNYGYFEFRQPIFCVTGDEDNRCDHSTLVEAPSGYQACRLTYDPERIRSGQIRVEAQSFYPDDPNIARFKAFNVTITARAYENKTTGAYLRNVRLWVLPDHYTDEQRRAFPCERPIRPATARPAASGSRPRPERETAPQGPLWSINKNQSSWVVRINRPMRVRTHTQCGRVHPYLENDIPAGANLIVHPNQWNEVALPPATWGSPLIWSLAPDISRCS